MVASRHHRLRVGIIGLGRLWEGRHKAALAKLSDRFRVTALYDQVARRAAREARELRCTAAEGLAALIERPDVDLVYILSPQWFGLHAAGLALAARKPVYSALPAAAYPDDLEALARSPGDSREVPFLTELARRFYPATLRLQELLTSRLGPPRRIVGHARFFGYDRYGQPGPATQSAPLPMAVDPGGNLLDWCRFIMQSEPIAIQAFGGSSRALRGGQPRDDHDASEDYGGFVLDFPDGAMAHITYERFHRDLWGEATRFLPPPGFQVSAEHGTAWLEMPDRIHWTDSSGMHEEPLPLEPTVGELLNEHIHRRILGQQAMIPTLDDAVVAARLVKALRLSRREGRRIDLTRTLPSTTS